MNDAEGPVEVDAAAEAVDAPEADLPAVAAPEAAPAPAGQGFGALLARARAEAGLSAEEIATRLRLHVRQVEAIEAENFGALPAAPYVSGFVRNYARELKLDPSALIDDLHGKLAQSGSPLATLDLRGAEVPRLPILDERRWRQLVLTAIVGVLVCGGLIGAWMAHQRKHAVSAPAAVATPSATPSGLAPAPAQDSAPLTAPPGVPPAGPIQAPSQSPAPVPAPPALAPPPARVAAATGAAGAPASPAAPPVREVAGPPPQRATNGLVLRFNDRSWVEVSDTEGRVLLSRTGEPGSLEMLNTSAPLLLVVGRADAVVVEYRGQAVDLKPFVTENGVARLTLADGRASSGGPNIR